MKKTLIAVAAAAALATSSAFAEVTFGAWLRTVTGVGYNGEDAVTGMSNSWSGMRPSRLNAAWTSEDEMAGMKLDIYYNDDDIHIGDNGYLWLKPVDMLKLSIGKFDGAETGLRGDFCFGSWNWLRPFNWIADDEGLTFNGSHKDGLMAALTPVEGLTVMVQLPVFNSIWGGNNNAYVAETPTSDAENTIEDTFKNAAYLAAYQIEGVGKIKVGYFGNYKEGKNDEGKDTKDIGQLNVAFDLYAVENLYATVGVRYNIFDYEEDANKDLVKVTAGVSYQITDEFKVSVSGGVKLYDGDIDPQFGIGAGIDYALMDGLALTADVRFLSDYTGDYPKEAKEEKDASISFLVGVIKSVGSNASLGIGFQGATEGIGLANPDWANGKGAIIPAEGDSFCWAIPVSMSIFF
ncbi:MAG: hypothetical protein J6K96_01275 [Treponema sp.]|nr:hypothetical protein [Treponema sp.]